MFGKKRSYLDWAASAPVGVSAAHAYARGTMLAGNPSSPHAEGRAAKDMLEAARTDIARLMQVQADDVIFTSGATEANNMVISGITAKYAMEKGVSPHVLYLPSAHASTVKTVQGLSAWGIASDPLPIQDGAIDVEAMKKMLKPETILVSMDFVCGETGTIWNTREVKHALPEHIYLHVDASQAPLEESIERSRIGGDLITLDAQKIGGVRGTGVLVAPRHIPLTHIMDGGGQERGLRPGTENVAGAAAFAAALAESAHTCKEFSARAVRSRAELLARISDIPNLVMNQGKKGVAHILNISLTGRDTDYLVALLDEAGFAVSTKSACESDSTEGSRAVFALTKDTARAASTLRVSWGPSTRERKLTAFAAALTEATAFLDGKGA